MGANAGSSQVAEKVFRQKLNDWKKIKDHYDVSKIKDN